ncbi:PEP-CTERM sorting domain-containing protein [Coraliomargarita akajimensis]|uniref:PEP-CTERM protein-sorting domain-containing protein n=1 Tax=Coraliomargarita akajimensis (strain DSM 45221 / IAM 15411 / JCM 23193 / KCTC 12865 / 04OKA010-24) TaxID=583355 RepID=D5ELQ3_CORAD|nr:PEP-CTERM sorting domain-containing protein [Coraliomargarita akajimensis]ADE53228.1 protein of unknown function DUF1555 [Coraliomargarita akajimensis DSM 45221]
MKKISLSLALCASSAVSVSAYNVVLVTGLANHMADDWYGVLDSHFDFGGADTLSFGAYDNYSGAAITDLENADLIVVSRTTVSDNYIQTGEAAYWNSLSSSMILANRFLARDQRFGWASENDVSVGSDTGSETDVSAAGSAFFGLSGAGGYDLMDAGFDSVGLLNGTNSFGDGEVFGEISGFGFSSVHWAAGDLTANGVSLGGERLFFGAEVGFSLTADGLTAVETAFDKMVVPEPSQYAMLVGLLGLGFTLLRRRA